MAMSNRVGKKELVAAVVVLGIGAWYVWPGSDDTTSAPVEPSAKVVSAVAVTLTKPATASAVPVKAKPSTASLLKEDQDVLDQYYHLAHMAQGDNPDGSDCANQAEGYVINEKGAQMAHDSFASDPQKAVDGANEFAKENPTLNLPLQTVEDAPTRMLKADKQTLAEVQHWLAKHGCRT